jgi:putative methionine-R-sulfoxide reductase with GAF domain
VTHDNRILDIADRILTLEDGRLRSFTSGLVSNTGNLFQTFAQLSRKGELQRQIGTMSDSQFVQLLEQTTAQFSELLQTMDIANNEASEALFADVLTAISARLRQVLQADRATIYLVDTAAGQLHSWVAEHDGKPLHITLPIGVGIAGRVAATGKPANLPDAYADPDFHRETDLETGYRTRSVLCMPMFDRSGKLLAVTQLLNKQNGEPFTTGDQEKFESYTPTLSLILETCARLQAQTSR